MRTTSYPRNPASGLTRLQDCVRTYLRAHSGETITRERLCREVWGMRYFNSSRTIDQTISVVRKHLGHEECILSVFGVGYRHLFRPYVFSGSASAGLRRKLRREPCRV